MSKHEEDHTIEPPPIGPPTILGISTSTLYWVVVFIFIVLVLLNGTRKDKEKDKARHRIGENYSQVDQTLKNKGSNK